MARRSRVGGRAATAAAQEAEEMQTPLTIAEGRALAAFNVTLPPARPGETPFEGPLDLLLHLIKEHKLDLFDIPIALITERYLFTLELMRELDIDIAGEFLHMAAQLMLMKSKLLLPRTEVAEEAAEDAGVDPRAELVRRLLDYQKYKMAGEDLGERDILDRDVFPRRFRAPVVMVDGPEGLADISVFKLIEALDRALKNAKPELQYEIVVDRLSGRSHRVGELLGGMKPPRAADPDATAKRPSYQEFSGDTPWEIAGSRRGPKHDKELEDEAFADEEDLGEADDDEEEEDEDLEEDDDLLEEDPDAEQTETIMYRGHPSWFSFAKGMLLALLLLLAAVGSIQFGGLKWLALGTAFSSLTFCCVIIARQHRDYLVTDERVEVEWGLIGRSSKEVRVQDIRSIDVIEGGVLGFLGIGTVDFSSAGTDGVEVQFKNVRRPHRIKELVRQMQKRAG